MQACRKDTNYVAASGSSSFSSGAASDENVTVETAYNADGQTLTLTAKNPTTGDQVTKYVYGADKGGITPEIYDNGLLRAEIYPDSDDTTDPLGNGPDGVYDRVEYKYNRQGERIEKKDPNGTVHQYDYDGSGQPPREYQEHGGAKDGSTPYVGYNYDESASAGEFTKGLRPTSVRY